MSSSMCGRMVDVTAVRMRIISRRISLSSSRMVLFASTISAGSMNTVLPVADSSCTMPRILRLYIGDTGITRRPSRTDGATSLSTYPASRADTRMRRSIPLMLDVVLAMLRRSSSSCGDALSRMLPNLSIIPDIAAVSSGKSCKLATEALSNGYCNEASSVPKKRAMSVIVASER